MRNQDRLPKADYFRMRYTNALENGLTSKAKYYKERLEQMNEPLTEDLSVRSITRCRAGMNPLFRVEFSDGFTMQSNERNEFIDTKYYKLMHKAIDSYAYSNSIGATSHEDLYNY
jgi:hypothetical protein